MISLVGGGLCISQPAKKHQAQKLTWLSKLVAPRLRERDEKRAAGVRELLKLVAWPFGAGPKCQNQTYIT